LSALLASQRGAGGALAQVRTQRPPLRERELAVELDRDRFSGLRAAEAVLQLLAQSSTGAEEQRLERRRGDPEHRRDVGVRAAFELAQHECRTLVRRELRLASAASSALQAFAAPRSADVSACAEAEALAETHFPKALAPAPLP
jgi:hypothetical protein